MKILYEVVDLTDSDLDNLEVEEKKVLDVKNIYRHILLNIIYKNIQDS